MPDKKHPDAREIARKAETRGEQDLKITEAASLPPMRSFMDWMSPWRGLTIHR